MLMTYEEVLKQTEERTKVLYPDNLRLPMSHERVVLPALNRRAKTSG